jgi:hypothetical protein
LTRKGDWDNFVIFDRYAIVVYKEEGIFCSVNTFEGKYKAQPYLRLAGFDIDVNSLAYLRRQVMAILRSLDGKFYDIPDEEAPKYEVPREKVKELLAKAGPGPGGGPSSGPNGGPGGINAPGGAPVVINIFPPHGAGGPPPAGDSGDVDPYWYYYYWRNY